MSDDVDKMLKEMEEFGRKYGFSAAKFSTSPAKKPARPKKNVFKDAKKIADNTAVAFGAGLAGVMMLNAAPAAGVAVIVFGPREAIAMKRNFVSALDKVKKDHPQMGKLKRFKKAVSLGMKGYAQEKKQYFKTLKGISKEHGIAAAAEVAISPSNNRFTADMLRTANLFFQKKNGRG